MSQYSQTQPYFDIASFPMPSLKRSRSNVAAKSAKRYKRAGGKAKSTIPGSGSNRCIIPLIVNYDMALTTDPAKGFAFDTTNYYIDGGAGVAINGATDIAAVFDMARIQKIEVTLMPAANSLDYNNQTIGTGVTNIPYVHTAVDYNEAGQPTLAEIQSNPTCTTGLLDKVFRRTYYPRLEGSNGVIDVGVNRNNIFMSTAAASTQKWNGFKVYIDMKTQVWTYGTCRISFKIFYECMQSK